jgi:glycosyltransferase involved in cell wall biosynthesis
MSAEPGRPRLLWLSHVLPHPPKGGVLQRSHHLIRGAAQAFEVDLASFRQRAFHPDAESVEASRRALSQLACVRAVVDLPVDRGRAARRRLYATSAFTRAPYSVRWNAAPAMHRALAGLAREQRYDLVHFDSIGMFQYRRHFPDAVWVLNHHNVESQMMYRRAEHAPPWLRPYLLWEAYRLRAWERRPGAEAARHVVVSQLDRERLLALLPGAAVDVVENAVDTGYFQPLGHGKRPGHVVFVGRIDAYANLAAARWLRDEIWPRLRAGGVARSLAIVGRNPPPEIVAWGRREPGVEVTGYVDDVRHALDEAEVFVCPITQGGGTRLKLLDALAMGLAVASHPMALEGLDVVPGEHVLAASDAEGLARAVEALLKDADLRARLGRAARARVEQLYSTAAVHRHLHDAYGRALAAGRTAR